MSALDVLIFGFVAGVIVLAIATASVRRKESRVARTEPCRSCGYSMLDAATDACPECGSEFDPSDRRPYFGRSRAITRSFAILLLAAASTIVVGNADLPARRLLEAHMNWAIQSVAGNSSADVMRITGRSNVHRQWSFDQTSGAAASFGGEPDQLPDGVDVDLRVIEFDWRGSTLRLTRDSESSPWVNDRGAVFDTSAVLNRLNAPENFGEYVHALLTMDWFDGQLNAYYRSVAFHRPGEYGPGTENPFERKRQPFHLTGIGWGWDAQTIGLYVAWALIWIVAVATIGLCFWVDRRKPSRKKAEATLPV